MNEYEEKHLFYDISHSEQNIYKAIVKRLTEDGIVGKIKCTVTICEKAWDDLREEVISKKPFYDHYEYIPLREKGIANILVEGVPVLKGRDNG